MKDYNAKASLEGAVNLNKELLIRVMVIEDTIVTDSFLQDVEYRKLFRGRLVVCFLTISHPFARVPVNDSSFLTAFG